MSRIPDRDRLTAAQSLLTLTSERLTITGDSENLAASLQAAGIKPMDALHLALASSGGADVFASTDDKLLKKGQEFSDLSCRVLSLLQLADEVTT